MKKLTLPKNPHKGLKIYCRSCRIDNCKCKNYDRQVYRVRIHIPGNSKKLLGFIRTFKNVPMVFCVTERDGQKRLIGDKFNPAYMSEVEGTTGKGGEDNKGVQFTIEAYSLPIVYEGTIQEPIVTP